MELQPEDRRGREPAGSRDGQEGADLPRHRVALQGPADPRREDEDRGHGREGELEAGVEQRVRVPGEQNERPDEQEPPTVALAGE